MKIINTSYDPDGIARIELVSDSGKAYIVCVDKEELKTWCDCPYYTYNKTPCKHIKFVLDNIDKSKIRREENMKYLKSGCDTIDNLLGGGFPYGMVVSVTSEPNIGKTKLGLQLSLANIKESEKKSLIIDTEGEMQEDQIEIMKRFANRFGLTEKDIKEKVKFMSVVGDMKEYGIQKLMRLLGYELKLEISKNGKFSADFIKIQPQLDGKILNDVSFILLDSITMPIKESVGNETQNLPARAAITQRLYGKLYQLAKQYNCVIVVNHHTSVNPVMPFGRDLGKIYGGQPVLYNSKYAIQLLDSTSAIKRAKFQGYESEARRVRLIRHPYKIAEGVLHDVRLQKDYGFTDIQ